MAITYSIAPNPHWVIIDDFSKLPNGAAIYTYSSLNPSVFKPAFTDSSGSTPYGQPIVGFGNGTMPPIFWQFDSANPTDLYYIRVYDSADVNTQNFLWDFNQLTGSGSGGGGTVTTALDIENLVINGEFYRNVGNLPVAPATSLPISITLAPSNNAGYVGRDTSGNFGPILPDIVFAKSDQSATDNLSFTDFTPIGISALPANPTPQLFVNYTTTVFGSETYKYIQFPIVKGLQNLTNATVSLKIFARLNSGNSNVTLTFRQFFGNGSNGPSTDVISPIGTLNFIGTSWTVSEFDSVVIQSISGKTLGNCGNDALFLQLNFPLSANFDVDFILPSLYLGDKPSLIDFHTLDFVDSIVNSPRTGDVRLSINAFILGWVAMNDGVLSNATGVFVLPAGFVVARRNIDTFPLFDLIWRTFQGSQTLAPMFTNGGVPVAYGANSDADFSGNRQLALTKAAGRILANIGVPSINSVPVTGGSNTGTVWAIGQSTGNELHTQSAAEVGPHVHPAISGNFYTNAGGATLQGGATFNASAQATTGTNTPNGTAFNIQQPTAYMNVFLKL